MTNASVETRPAELSLVMPCYNEEAIVAQTIKRVLAAFARADVALELIAVDNGSHDRTGELIREIMDTNGNVRLHRVEVNIRPENAASLAVVRKLGLRDEGVRERMLHIDGAWRDHRSFAITVEELHGGRLVDRLEHQ